MSRTSKITLLAALIASSTLTPYIVVAQDASSQTKSETNPALLPKKQNTSGAATETKGNSEAGNASGRVDAAGQTQTKTPAADTKSAVGSESQAKPPVNAEAPLQKKGAGHQNAGGTDAGEPAGKTKAGADSGETNRKSGSVTTPKTPDAAETTKSTDTTGSSKTKTETTGTAGATNGDVSGSPSAATKEQKAGSQVNVNVTTEQRTEIRNVIIENKVEPVRPTFSISVGTAVPRTVRLHKLPARVIQIVPQYRDYEYIVLADERIIIIDPATYEIVYVLTI